MKVLFSALHFACYRNFESVVRALADRGHAVHLTADEPETLGGRELAERLGAEYPAVTHELLPSLEHEPWFEAARTLRVALDYVRVLDPRYAPKLRLRTEMRAARLVRWAVRLPAGGRSVSLRALKRFERLMPASERMVAYLREQAPDLVVVTSLTTSRSQQMDVLKAARACGLPVAAAIMSWDHLSSKALLHVAPDMVLVWNTVQVREAVEMHGLPPDRVVSTGAQCYDQWFTRVPQRSHEEFCRAVGLRPDRPFVLWVSSAITPVPDPPEPFLIKQWIQGLRSSADTRLRDLGVLVRPHPERLKEWAGVTLDGYENVAVYGRNPIDPETKNDYFDSLYYSSAVIGLVTSAFIEAAIVGRPVLTLALPQFRMHQEEMVHFRYLTDVAGGILHLAPDIPTHLAQLAGAVSSGRARDVRNRRFVESFVRPFGLDVPATPAFVEALERLDRRGPLGDPTLDQAAWLRAAAVKLASWGRSGPGRWLLDDRRDDESARHERAAERSLEARREAKAARQRAKARRGERRRRRDAVMRLGKEVKGAILRARYRAAVAVHRGLGTAGVGHDEVPPGGKNA